MNFSKLIPDHIRATDENRTDKTLTKWSASFPVPAIGHRVNVFMNSLGPGTVTGYFVLEGWLGVQVELDNPPQWWLRQNKNKRTAATVFGAEITPLGGPPTVPAPTTAKAREIAPQLGARIFVDLFGHPTKR